MRSTIINAALLLGMIAMFGCAAGYSVKRQEMWDTARAENRCAWGYTAYCDDVGGV